MYAVPLLTSCATTSNIQEPLIPVKEAQVPAEEKKSPVDVEKKSPVDEMFIDWEYKGFGRELPAWVEQYFSGGAAAVQAECPEYAEKEVRIISASGKDADQAEQALEKNITDDTVVNEYVPKESMWVCLRRPKDITLYGGNSYVSLYLYVKR